MIQEVNGPIVVSLTFLQLVELAGVVFAGASPLLIYTIRTNRRILLLEDAVESLTTLVERHDKQLERTRISAEVERQTVTRLAELYLDEETTPTPSEG